MNPLDGVVAKLAAARDLLDAWTQSPLADRDEYDDRPRCDRCGEPEQEGPGGAFQALWGGGFVHLDCREPEEVPAYCCGSCGDVVTEAGTREGGDQFPDADGLPLQDPPIEVGEDPSTGQECSRCEVCEWEAGTEWQAIPPHPGA